MKSWVLTAPNTFELLSEERDIEGEQVKVKVTKAAITSTDLAMYTGKISNYPIIPVRLAVGLVSNAPHDSGFKIGQKVVISPYVKTDADTLGSYSTFGNEINGLLGDYTIVPIENVFHLPDGVTETEAVFTEYVAIAMRIIEKLDIDKMKYVVILGSNALGIILAQLCIYYQAIPIIIDSNKVKLSVAQKCGIYYTIDLNTEDPKQAVTSITGGNMADITVYECKDGRAHNNIYNYTRYGGMVGIVSYDKSINNKFNLDIKSIYKKELTIIGINNGKDEWASALNILANKILLVDDLIDLEGDYENVPELFKLSVDLCDSLIKSVVNIK